MEIRYKAILFLLLSAILWSTGGLFIKLIPLNPVAIAGVRGFISMVVLLVYVRHPRFTWSVAQIGGAIAFALTVTLFVVATKLTTAANAVPPQRTRTDTKPMITLNSITSSFIISIWLRTLFNTLLVPPFTG